MSTVAAISTAPAIGAIGIVRLTGKEAISIADKVFSAYSKKKLSTLKGYTASFGEICFEGEVIDEGVATVFRSPKSYTGEDMVEITCHGNPIIASMVLKALISSGAMPAGAGEFTKRAFLNGKMDLTKADAVSELISANGEASLRLAKRRREGELTNRIDSICEELTTVSAKLAVWLDYPDDDDMAIPYEEVIAVTKSLIPNLKALLDGYNDAKKIMQGVNVAIVGRPNAGKSTLMNLLSGEERSIVTHYAGTTRDVVENVISLGNLSIRLLDTAGIRKTSDPVETIGVERAYRELEKAEIALLVVDVNKPLEDEDREFFALLKDRKYIVILSKTDLGVNNDTKSEVTALSSGRDTAFLDGATGEGLISIKELLTSLALSSSGDDMLIANQREFSLINTAYTGTKELETLAEQAMPYDILGIKVDEILEALWEIVGKNASEEVIKSIFEKFCVGK